MREIVFFWSSKFQNVYFVIFVKFICLFCFRLLFFAANKSLERDLVSYNIISGSVVILYNNNNSESIRLTVDNLNKNIYWVSYNDSSLILRKSDYDGNTNEISNSYSQFGNPGITQIGLYYYVLDSLNSRIQKYDKTNDMVVLNISTFSGVSELIAVTGKSISQYCLAMKILPNKLQN